MDDNFRKGFIMGMAMNPLYVVAEQRSMPASDNFCVDFAVTDGSVCDDGICVFINEEDD